MTDTVERVARAICEAEGLDWGAQTNCLTSGAGNDNEQEHYFHLAQAALTASNHHALIEALGAARPILKREVEKCMVQPVRAPATATNTRAMKDALAKIDAALAAAKPSGGGETRAPRVLNSEGETG